MWTDKNKLQLGAAGNLFHEMAMMQLHQDREERARLRALKRQEEMLRLSEEERTEKRNRNIRALQSALREYAAADFLQRVVRGALSRLAKKKLRLKQSAFLRGFSADGAPRESLSLTVTLRSLLAARL